MSKMIFITEDANFEFNREAVMQCLEDRKPSYDVQELDNLIDVISNQPDQINLSSAEHPYFGFIALDLINKSSEGYAFCRNCEQKYRFKELEAYTVGPDDATFKAATVKKGGFKNLFRKKLKPPGMYGGKGYRCSRGHILIYMQTWIS